MIRVKQDDSSMSESHMSPDDRLYQNEMDTSYGSSADVLPSTSAEAHVAGKLEAQPSGRGKGNVFYCQFNHFWCSVWLLVVAVSAGALDNLSH